MKAEDTKDPVEDPFTEYGSYSYKDYLTWQIDEMVELIKGKAFKMAAAPKRSWIIHPEEQTLLIYTLIHGEYVPSRLFTVGDRVNSGCI